jgi:hypothetical protein
MTIWSNVPSRIGSSCDEPLKKSFHPLNPTQKRASTALGIEFLFWVILANTLRTTATAGDANGI